MRRRIVLRVADDMATEAYHLFRFRNRRLRPPGTGAGANVLSLADQIRDEQAALFAPAIGAQL